MRQILEIEFLSDWHIGSGAGIPGSVDRTVLKDADGIPYVPGRTITGMLRDSAEFVAGARDGAEGGTKWTDAFKSLFGGRQTPGEKIMPAKIGIGDAVFSEELKNILKCHAGLRQALFIVQPGIKINRATGRTEADHLFFREEARGGCTLRANIQRIDKLSDDEEKLLEDAVKATRRIGGHRRRGGGRCGISMKDAGSHQNEQNTNTACAQTFDSNCLENDTLELEYVLETLQPVIINRVTIGNEARSERFIPGTSLLPVFHKKMRSDGDLYKTIGTAIGKGEFSVGPFYPEKWNNLTYPAPFSYSCEKEDTSVTINRLVAKPRDNHVQMKDIRSEYAAPDERGTNVKLSSKEKEFMIYRTHNAVDDEKQRPTESSGGPYTFQAIDAGVRFRGTIRLSGDFWKNLQDKEKFINSLTPEVTTSIGLSKKDEYGGVKITFAGIHRAPAAISGLLKDRYIVVYLASDALVRNKDTLAFTGSVDDFRDALADTLNTDKLRVSLKNVDFNDTNPLGGDRGNCVRFGRRESWHSKWELPRPSLVYLQAGSVFLFEAENRGGSGFDWDAAQKKLFQGIGDRRAEGYGRVLLSPKFLCGSNVGISRGTDNDERRGNPDDTGDQRARNKANEPEALSENDGNFLSRLKKEHVKAAFAKAARRVAADFVWSDNDEFCLFKNVSLKKGAPSTSQFGILREIAAAISERGNMTPAEPLFDAQASRRSQFTRIWSEHWIVWLENVTGGAVDLWNVMAGDTVLDGEIRRDLAVFAVSTFLDIFCEAVFDKFSKGGKP